MRNIKILFYYKHVFRCNRFQTTFYVHASAQDGLARLIRGEGIKMLELDVRNSYRIIRIIIETYRISRLKSWNSKKHVSIMRLEFSL